MSIQHLTAFIRRIVMKVNLMGKRNGKYTTTIGDSTLGTPPIGFTPTGFVEQEDRGGDLDTETKSRGKVSNKVVRR